MTEVSYNPKNDVLSIYFKDPADIDNGDIIISCGNGIEVITIEDTDTIAGIKVAKLSSYLEEKDLTLSEKKFSHETEGFTLEEFISYMEDKVKKAEFSAGAIYMRESDALELYFKDVQHYAYGETEISMVDLYLDMKNENIVGCRIWNISDIIKEKVN